MLNLGLKKREKIIISTVLLTIGLLISTQVTNFIFIQLRIIVGLGAMAYLLSLWALWEGMTKTKAILLLVLPTLFTVAIASFYFLLPNRWLSRLPVIVSFGVSFYLILLSQNIFNVASIRNIPLARVASITSFVFSIFTAFLLFVDLYALNLPFYWNGVAVFVISFILILPVFWSIEMDKIDVAVIMYALVISTLMAESGVALSFWPLAPSFWTLALSTQLGTMLSILTEHQKDKLTFPTVAVDSFIGIMILLTVFFATSWTG